MFGEEMCLLSHAGISGILHIAHHYTVRSAFFSLPMTIMFYLAPQHPAENTVLFLNDHKQVFICSFH